MLGVASSKTVECRLGFDVSQLNAQVEALPLSELSELGLDALSDLLQRYISGVSVDILCGEGVTTTLADNSIKIVYTLRLGDDFYDLFAALRAEKLNNI